MTEALRLVVLKEIPEDAELRRQWNALVDRVERPQVFYTYEWSLAVQRAYSSTLHPLLILAYDDADSLYGVAALATGSDSHSASFLCATTGDYCDFLSEATQKAEFMIAALRELTKRKIRRIALANLPADSSTLPMLQKSGRECGFHCYARTAYICAQVSFDRLERGKDGRPFAPGLKRLRRFEKAMKSEAEVRTEHRQSWDAVEPVLQEFMQAHVARFLEIGRISNIADSHRRVFLAELARVLSASQWFVLSRMLVGERPVAWHYGFKFHGSWFWYQPTFDSTVEKHWPGFCLLSQVIQDSIEIPGMTMLDLGLGSEAYKAKFANESRETLFVSLHRSVLAHSRAIVRHKVAEAVKSSPKWESLANGVRQRVRAFRMRLRAHGLSGSISWIGRGVLRPICRRSQVVFFEMEACKAEPAATCNLELRPLELRHLALAAMEYRDDDATCTYLLRAAKRLRTSAAQGFVLTDTDGHPLHLAWTSPLNGFFCEELDSTLEAPSDSVILFDCWTPTAMRGQDYYQRAIKQIGARIRESGKRPWIFSASTNLASIAGIERAGYQKRYSLVREQFLAWKRIKRAAPEFDTLPDVEVSARV